MLDPTDPRHGERRGYLAGCREACCREATTDYMAEYSADPAWRVRQAKFNKASRHRRHKLRELGVDRSMHPAAPVREHVQALLDLGWTATAIAAVHGGISHGAVSQLMRVGNETVQYKTWKLLEVPLTLRVPPEVPDAAMVPKLGAERRVQALLALGWSHELQREHAGVTKMRANLYHDQINAGKWRRVDDVYRQLSGKAGPSRKTRTRAVNLGYAPPLAWEDIDDPNEKPRAAKVAREDMFDETAVLRRMAGDKIDGDWVPLHSVAESVEVVRRLHHEHGLSYQEIHRRTGLNADRYKERAVKAHNALLVEGAARAAQKGKAA
jgi:hypothetical protein